MCSLNGQCSERLIAPIASLGSVLITVLILADIKLLYDRTPEAGGHGASDSAGKATLGWRRGSPVWEAMRYFSDIAQLQSRLTSLIEDHGRLSLTS
jgi:hypothetical protein